MNEATDLIADAPDVSQHGLVASGSAPWDNTAATSTGDGTGFGNKVWHKVYLGAPGLCTFQHDTSVNGDTYMYLYRGPENATELQALLATADDNAGNGKPRITYESPGNEWLYIGSTGYNSGRYSGQFMLFTIPTLVIGATGHTTVYVDGYIAPSYIADIQASTMFENPALALPVEPFALQGSVGVAVPQGIAIPARVLSSGTVDVHKQYEDLAQPVPYFS